MDDHIPKPIERTPPVLLQVAFRASKRWLEGPGRRAGLLLIVLPITALLGLILMIWLTNRVCSLLASFETCSTAFSLVNRTVGIALLGLALLCVCTLLARIPLAIRRIRKRREADLQVTELRARLGGADPLLDPAYAEIHAAWRLGKGPDESARRVAYFLLTPSLLLIAIVVLTFNAASVFFNETGSLFPTEFTSRGINYGLTEACLFAALWLASRSVRSLVGSFRLARERAAEFEISRAGEEARLLRAHEDPDNLDAPSAAFTFRPWAAAASKP